MISLYSELLQTRYSDKLDTTGAEYLAIVVDGSSRMHRLLRDLRTYTHASVLSKESVSAIDAEVVFERVLKTLQPIVDECAAKITASPLPAAIIIHEFELEQLFQNMIGNALRYRGEATPKVHVEAALIADGWCFSIRDNGIGIHPEYTEQIFELFTRLHSTSEYPGTGMGLAICKRIIDRLGGRIWVESEPGQGSTFFFVVPAARSAHH